VLKRRLIPVLFLREGIMVRSEGFARHQHFGHPVSLVERMNQWDVDELIVLDISPEGADFTIQRDDHKLKGSESVLDFIARIAAECTIPLTFGGRIRSFDDIRLRIQNGADKVALNSALAKRPELVTEAAHAFGSQAIVASIDHRTEGDTAPVFTHRGTRALGRDAADWARELADRGAGEILLNSIERDGTGKGYDLATIDRVARAVEIPVIACGGCGHQLHFAKCFQETEASAVAAGNIFWFTENAYPRFKRFLRERGAAVR
jgi:cyclase